MEDLYIVIESTKEVACWYGGKESNTNKTAFITVGSLKKLEMRGKKGCCRYAPNVTTHHYGSKKTTVIAEDKLEEALRGTILGWVARSRQWPGRTVKKELPAQMGGMKVGEVLT